MPAPVRKPTVLAGVPDLVGRVLRDCRGDVHAMIVIACGRDGVVVEVLAGGDLTPDQEIAVDVVADGAGALLREKLGR